MFDADETGIRRIGGGVQRLSTSVDFCRTPLPIVPQRAYYLRRCDVVGVVRNQPQEERAVLPQVPDHKPRHEAPIVTGPSGRRQPAAEQQMVGDEPLPIWKQQGPQQPDDEARHARHGDGDHPEPEEHVDLLVVEVHRKDALYGVCLDVAEVLAADLEVAERHTWKRDVAVFGPVGAGRQVGKHVGAEGRVACRQHLVEYEQLTDHVDDVA